MRPIPDLPPSEHIRPRPVWVRYQMRLLAPHELVLPTEEEISDAMEVIATGSVLTDPLHQEAIRILEEFIEVLEETKDQ